MSMMPLFYSAGYNLTEVCQGWIISFLVAYMASQIFAQLASSSANSHIHESVAYAFNCPRFERTIEYFMFYLYLLCSVLGLAILAMIFTDIIVYLYRLLYTGGQASLQVHLLVHCILLCTIFIMNIFFTSRSKHMMHNILSYVKIIITIGVPLIAIASQPSLFDLSTQSVCKASSSFWTFIKTIPVSLNMNAVKVAFETVFAMSGAESLMMVIDKKAGASTANRAMFYGLFICLAIYIFNTFVCFKVVDLETCSAREISPYILMLPSSHLIGNIIVNILMALMLASSIYGWFDVVKEMCVSAPRLTPAIFRDATDNTKISMIIFIIAAMLCVIELSRKTIPNFLYIFFSLVNFITVAVYLVGIIAFVVQKLSSTQNRAECK